MKRNLYLLGFLLLTSVGFVACDKVKDAVKEATKVSTDLDLQGQDFELPAGLDSAVGITYPFDTTITEMPFATNIDMYIDSFNVDPDQIKSVILKQVQLTVKNPVGGNFDYLQNIKLDIRGGSLPKIALAEKLNIPTGTTQLDFDVAGVSLKEYLLEDTIYISVRGTFQSAPPANSVLTFNGKMHLEANAIK